MVGKEFAARCGIVFDHTKDLVGFGDQLRAKEGAVIVDYFLFFFRDIRHHGTPTFGGSSDHDVSDSDAVRLSHGLLQESFELYHHILVSEEV